MEIYYLGVAVLGWLLTILSGWAGSGEPFNFRKFFVSAAAVILGSLFIARQMGGEPVTYNTLILAAIVGAGSDAGGKRAWDGAQLLWNKVFGS